MLRKDSNLTAQLRRANRSRTTPSSRRRPLRLESLESRRVLSTFTVVNTDDNGAGSLRQAIIEAYDNAGADLIAFNIPGPGVHTIAPLTNLPPTSDVTIDGTTQPGFVDGGPRLIELSGVNYEVSTFPFDDYGLYLGSNSTVKGLAINRFWHGIFVSDNGDNQSIQIAGNYIGTDPTGGFAVPNTIGVFLGGSNNLLGRNGDGVNDEAERNIISGNSQQGVELGGNSNVVAGNYIGADATGLLPLGQFWGVRGGGYGGTIVGNLISGNHEGINPSGFDVVVQGNLIGTDKTGETALGNEIGVFVQFLHKPVLIGGTTPQARNYIAGNGAGIRMNADSIIQGNYIGRTPAGVDLGNGYGIYQDASGGSSLVGGRLPGQGNVIAGNSHGISLRHNSAGANHVEGNLIVHNSHGVNIGNGAFNQVIGGTDAGAGNTIAFNGVGVVLSRSVGTIPPHPSYPYAKQNRIVGNSIHDNTALGIDLSDGGGNEADGVTPNDPLDTDTGSNEFQNFPVLIAASSGASPHVRGALNSTPNSTFVLDFYASSAADPSGYGEGERYLGAATVVTDAVGNATFNVSLSSALQFGEYVTATATDSAGNTSEFSAAVLASVLEVQIDVKPGDTSNTVNVDSNGVIAVAILTTAEFDAALVNAGSVIFAGAQAVQSALEDVNGDGRLDLLLHFRTQDTSLRSIYEQLLADDMNGDGVLDSNHQAATVTLTGETVDHAFIEGVDTLDLFLSGKALRSFLDALAAAGAI